MTHIWLRSEHRDNERRVGITPKGAQKIIKKGYTVTVEESRSRVFPISEYKKAGCIIAKENSWPNAPSDAIVFGLKELPDDSTPLRHRHIMFGHAFKGQHTGRTLLRRFKSHGGILYDIEYLVDNTGKRVAAFGYWAGYVGAAVALKAWLSQKKGRRSNPVNTYKSKNSLIAELSKEIVASNEALPRVIVIGALGRVGSGANDLCRMLGLKVTKWDLKETADGGSFKRILEHDIFLNCILADRDTPVFFSEADIKKTRRLGVIGDIACDSDSDYNPIPIYNSTTSWETPSKRIFSHPALDVVAIDNLPSLLPKESSIDFASQLLPYLMELDNLNEGVWNTAEEIFKKKLAEV